MAVETSKIESFPSWIWWIAGFAGVVLIFGSIWWPSHKKGTSPKDNTKIELTVPPTAESMASTTSKSKWVLSYSDPTGKTNPWPTEASVMTTGDSLVVIYKASVGTGMFTGRKKANGAYEGEWKDHVGSGPFELFFANANLLKGWHSNKGGKEKFPLWIERR